MRQGAIVLAWAEMDVLGGGVEVQRTVVMTWMGFEGESLVVKNHLYFDLIGKGGVAVAEVRGVELSAYVTSSIME